jgi:hypothetical protein
MHCPSQDVEKEMQASRIRVRAERRLGEILKRMASASGEFDAESVRARHGALACYGFEARKRSR